ncbi:MAG: two-component system, OmpR family, sensor histidine kinase MprB [Solirubrobacteraceae bacterium]|nr:two-component system, OmpR family, sensor histidine kinase MprB [Solirubrobacteraceae bacterium]
MSLRRRLALIAAASVAIAVLIAAAVCYLVVRGQLVSQVDSALTAQASAVQQTGDLHAIAQQVPGIPASRGGPAQYVQFVTSTGSIIHGQGDLTLPVGTQVRLVASGRAGTVLGDIHVGGNHLREIIFPWQVLIGGQPQTVAVQLARPLNGVDGVLSMLRLVLLLVVLGGIALAAALGRLAGRRVLAPLAEVAQAAQHISETDDLSRRIQVHADDEVGQVATRFNAMLDRLESSRGELDDSMRAQRQLVADASHELRTPVTSLRTNIEVLLAEAELEPEDRRRLLSDVVEQSEELTALVGDLIELARGDEPGFATEDVRLDRVAEEAVARARRNAPAIEFTTALEPVSMDGVAARLERAINNLLDNAARHSPPGGIVELTVDGDGVEVRDHGRGVVDQDLPYVFDRFFRGTGARGRHGSGLGLAIVRQVTEQHGGTATAANAPDGGAVFRLHLPVVPAGDQAASEATAWS